MTELFPPEVGRLPPFTVLSLGWGVQSWTLAMMMRDGTLPAADLALNADTHHEAAATVAFMAEHRSRLLMPLSVVSGGDLGTAALAPRTSRDGRPYLRTLLPAWIASPTRGAAPLMRSCTRDFKVRPLLRAAIRAAGRRPITMLMGISLDEASRAKPSQHPRITHSWPLLTLGMTRADCLDYLAKNGHPIPPRSACYFCPHASDIRWKNLRTSDPTSFDAAVAFEAALQAQTAALAPDRPTPFLHRSLKPLGSITFSAPKDSATLIRSADDCQAGCGL